MTAGRKVLTAVVTTVSTLFALVAMLNLSLGNKQVDTRLERHYSIEDEQFTRAMAAALSTGWTAGNHVQELLNGEQVFRAMLQDIRASRSTITFETYIYWSGSIGREIASALAERSRHGVKVHVLLDWFGGQLDAAMLDRMRSAGVEVRRYNPPRLYNLDQLNNRTHRRLLVVDGEVGFIGGVGIADKWRGEAQDPQHWRDTHFRVRGPAVAQIQSAFMDNWMQATGEVLHGPLYLPEVSTAGSMPAHVFTSSPGGGAESMQLMYLLSITAAERSIDLSASYFVPDDVAIDSLVSAMRRGVRLRLILPGPHIDVPVVRRASRAEWGELLEAGAEIYEYQPTMFHCKVMVVDALLVSVGSTNFDNRSFSINDEANMNIYDAAFARRQIDIFEEDLKRSRRITLEEWRGRPWKDHLLDWAASLVGSQL